MSPLLYNYDANQTISQNLFLFMTVNLIEFNLLLFNIYLTFFTS